MVNIEGTQPFVHRQICFVTVLLFWMGPVTSRLCVLSPVTSLRFISPLMLINVARWSSASSPRSNICPSHNRGCWMLLIWGRGNMKAFKCLMGVGQGSRVRATNDNVLRRAWVSASWERLCWWFSSACLCVLVCLFFSPLPFSSFFFWFICVLLGYVHLSWSRPALST